MLAVSEGQRGFFILFYAPGGTGKTFLISLILAEIRSNNGIALAVALSGIAATLLDGGSTAHSAFKLPLNIQNNPDAVSLERIYMAEQRLPGRLVYIYIDTENWFTFLSCKKTNIIIECQEEVFLKKKSVSIECKHITCRISMNHG